MTTAVGGKHGRLAEPVMRVHADCTSEQIARFLRGDDVSTPARRRRVDCVRKPRSVFHLLLKLNDLIFLSRDRLQHRFM